MQAVKKEQTFPIEGSDNEPQTGGKEDYGICFEEVIIKEEKCVGESDIEEPNPVFYEEKDVIVKEEWQSSDDKDDTEICHKFVNNVKCDPISSDVSDNKDVSEDFKESGNSSENNLTELKKNKVKLKKNRFQCDICDKEYAYKQLLDYHLTRHAGIKAFSCLKCNKKFLTKNHLISHEKIHSGIKNFECSICNKKFLRKSEIILHEKIHNNIKNFECSVCKKKFYQKVHLNRHEKIHTGVKNFECSVCNRKFSQKAHLTGHEKVHTAVKSFEFFTCK